MKQSSYPSLDLAFSADRSFEDLKAICPHCSTTSSYEEIMRHEAHGPWFDVEFIIEYQSGRCRGCWGIAVGILALENPSSYESAKHAEFRHKASAYLLYPAVSWPDRAPEEIEPHIKSDYDQARSVIAISPNASAVLSRRCLQHVIRAKLGIKRRTLFKEIDVVCKKDDLSKRTKAELSHVREIGNWGAHPMRDKADPAWTVVEVTRQDAEYTLKVLEHLFKDLYDDDSDYQAMSQKIATVKAQVKK